MSVDQLAAGAVAGGPWAILIGLIVGCVRAVSSGAWVPRRTVDMINAQWEARLTEAHTRERQWQAAYQNERAAHDASDTVAAKMITYAEAADRVLASLPTSPTEGSPRGH